VARIGPIARRDLIGVFRRLGFDGPYAGGNHEYMRRAGHKVYIPNPHDGVISGPFLRRLLDQAGVTPEEWGRL